MSQTKAQLIDPVDGTIVNADINASAAIAGSKISPNFGSQAISSGDLTITSAAPFINFIDSDHNSDFNIQINAGGLNFNDTTNSATRMSINSSGNVGIGTTSPSALLDVANSGGAAEIILSSSTQPRLMLKTTGTTAECRIDFGDSGDSSRGAVGYNHNDDALKFYTTGVANERMRIDSSGNVGIGTTSPTDYNNLAENLVVATSSDTGITIATGTSSQGSLFFADGTSGSAMVEGFVAYEHSNNALKIGTNNAERMRIDSSGDVGLGTSSPNLTGYTSPVTSIGTTSNGYSVLELQGAQSSNGAIGVITGYNTSGSSRIAAINWNRFGGNNYGAISFETANNGSLGERCRITNDGLTFNGDTAAANALDDYEEGTWTPTSNVGAITVATAHYVKIGSSVTFQAYITFPSMSGTSEVKLTNFPFDVNGGSDYHSCAVNSNANIGGAQIVGQFNDGNFMVFAKPDNSKANPTELSGRFVLFSCTIMTH